jgi:hypothetical protein
MEPNPLNPFYSLSHLRTTTWFYLQLDQYIHSSSGAQQLIPADKAIDNVSRNTK